LQKKGYVFDCSIDAKNKTEALIVANKSIISKKIIWSQWLISNLLAPVKRNVQLTVLKKLHN